MAVKVTAEVVTTTVVRIEMDKETAVLLEMFLDPKKTFVHIDQNTKLQELLEHLSETINGLR